MDPLRDLVLRLYPGATIDELVPLGVDDDAAAAATRKGLGYGVPVRVRLHDAEGRPCELVFHTARPDTYGHDRRADRVQEMVLAYDTFGDIPGHVRAIDVGLIGDDGTLRSLSGTGEAYLLTAWAEGEPYAGDLRRIARDGAGAQDLRRVDVLADALVAMHRRRIARPAAYARAVRDLIGSGEGIYGIVDGYPDAAPAASPARLRRIEQRAAGWRWRLRDRAGRLCRIHGDFHPFNLVLDGDRLALLDASRGCEGEAADDLTALAVNYVFFALDAPGAWRGGLGALWHRLWDRYLAATGDREVLAVAPPWLAWRALVVASPRWYPGLTARGRDALLSWVERTLEAGRLDPATADEVAA
jgi:hypothetical protein